MNQYDPDIVFPPGRTLQETLEALEISQSELAERTGRPKKTINEIIKGKAALTPETALQLERALGIPSAFWNSRETHYREFLARQEERKRLDSGTNWLDELPVADMVKLGWIRFHSDKVRQIQEILDFFGVASPRCWTRFWMGPKIAFRRSPAFRNDPGLLAGWLRMGELEGRRMPCKPFAGKRFEKSLHAVRALTLESPEEYVATLTELCAEAGVALVFLPEPPRLSISGATRWLSHKKAMIQISLRYNTDDQFWLTFFHEAGHILLHSKKDVFLEDDDKRTIHERDADEFAMDLLVPNQAMQRFAARGDWSHAALSDFAREIGLAPGVLIGVLQHRGQLAHSQHNGFKRLFKLKAS